ncbi:MAG: PAAR domain-containing protein [Polyangiaceae bacterium]|nr:PAAR domain-containing protein [Polyangiaceae bacterium]
MSAPPLFTAAKQGDRISHNPDQSNRSVATMLAELGQTLSSAGSSGMIAAATGAAVSTGAAKGSLSITAFLPKLTTGTVEKASPTVMVAPGIGAALTEAHPVDCSNHRDKPIAPGTSTVLVQGLHLALTGGQTECGAILCDGAPTVLVGGAPPATAAGNNTQGGNPVLDAIAHAQDLAGHIQAAFAAVERGAELIENAVTETVEKVQDAVQGAVGAVTGVWTGVTSGGVLGALTGASL